MAVKMGEFLGILMNITNKQTNQAYPEDDVRTKFKNQRVIGLIGVSERKKPGKNFIKIFDPNRGLTILMEGHILDLSPRRLRAKIIRLHKICDFMSNYFRSPTAPAEGRKEHLR